MSKPVVPLNKPGNSREPRFKPDPNSTHKTCRGCSKNKPVSEFYLHKGIPYGQCKICRLYRATKANRLRGTKEFVPQVVTNSHKQCSRCKELKLLDEFSNDKRRSAGKAAYCRSCSKIAARNSPEYIRSYYNKWRELNPELARAKNQIRCDRINELSDGTVTRQFLVELYQRENCSYCHKYVDKSKRTADHVTPIARGGKHTKTNLVMACRSCNSSKGTLDVQEFLKYNRE